MERFQVWKGDEIIAENSTVNATLKGTLKCLKEYSLQPVGGVMMQAVSGAPLDNAVVEAFLEGVFADAGNGVGQVNGRQGGGAGEGHHTDGFQTSGEVHHSEGGAAGEGQGKGQDGRCHGNSEVTQQRAQDLNNTCDHGTKECTAGGDACGKHWCNNHHAFRYVL